MSDVPPAESTIPTTAVSPTTPTTPEGVKPLTPQRCILGSVIAGGLSYAMYLMTSSIAQSFAVHKVQSTSLIVQRISAAVRTLVVGMTTLGTGVFGLAAIGLFALAIQLIVQHRNQAASPPQ